MASATKQSKESVKPVVGPVPNKATLTTSNPAKPLVAPNPSDSPKVVDPSKNYDSKACEAKWQNAWIDWGVYSFDPESNKPIYSIDTPPPTVSGKMHIGHAFSYSQMDILVRYKRMKGFNIFFPFGTDDNGLPTERLVEREKKVKGTRMPRREFQKICLEYLKENTPAFIADWKSIGMSCDWSIHYSTINDHCQRISQKSFIDLYKAGREYRKNAPSIWCPECATAIAQVELQDMEIQSSFNDLVFESSEGAKLLIATTRPELLPACVAVFANPADERYKKLFGKKVKVPLFGQEVTILADPRADPEKGTGLVMCCTFGDQTDIEWYKAHNLPNKVAITADGRMTDLCGEFAGLKIKEARKAIIDRLKEKGLLVSQKPISHMVNVHERCKTEIEILETPQWFIKYLDLREDFLKAGDELVWHPAHMKNRLDNWIKGLQWDWCISRQRYFGVPFPVWYCKKCGEVILASDSQLPVDPLEDKPVGACPKCKSTEFVPEKDVLDTWATSSLTPRITVELFKDKPVYKKLFPMSLRPQAHDIISFWLFNTLVKSRLHFGVNPWKEIAVSGWALDPKGRKMSKSLGNVVDPRVVLAKFPADAVRYWAAGSKLGDDMPYQEKDLVTGNKTVTKLWNAAKFSSMHLADFDGKKPAKLDLYDKAMLSRVARLVKECTTGFEDYEYHRAKLAVDTFFWHDLCDDYLEVVKDRMYNGGTRGSESRKSAQYTLYTSLLTCLKIFAPIMPHITEEVYQSYFLGKEKDKSIHTASWPVVDEKSIDPNAEKAWDLVSYAVSHARKAKSEQNVSLKTPIKKLVLRAKITPAEFEAVKADIVAATCAESISYEQLKPDCAAEAEHELVM